MELSNLKLEDLVNRCPQCHGTGLITPPPSPTMPSMGLLAAARMPCSYCEDGHVYTPLGKTLRDFVRIAR